MNTQNENMDSAAGRIPPAERGTRRFSDRLVQLYYRIFPTHLLGEILSKNWIDNAAPFIFLVLTILTFGSIVDGFFEVSSLTETMRLIGEFGLLVLGMMIVLVGGGIDLSVGSTFALANFVSLACMNIFGLSVEVAFLAAVASAMLVGLTNGILIGYFKLRAFLTTLAILIVVRAIVDMLLVEYASDISAVFVDNELWYSIGEGSIWGVPVSVLIFAVVAIAVHLLLSRMRVGWRILSVGGSRRSAHNMGINVPGIVCLTYVICGALPVLRASCTQRVCPVLVLIQGLVWKFPFLRQPFWAVTPWVGGVGPP